MDEKELRIVEYALHTLLSNWDEEIDEENMAEDGITLKDIQRYTRRIENQLEEIASSK
jgi:hypothetical protein